MKLLVFGSTGGTGRWIVEQALSQGHDVAAFVRSPEKLGISNASVEVIRGDVMEADSVEVAVQGREAVLSALGAGFRRSTLRTEGTRNIVRAMEKAGVRRLVSQSSLGVGDSRDLLPFHYKYGIVPLLLRHAFADHEGQEAVIRGSGLDWTIVRPGNLTDDGRTEEYRHGFTADDKATRLKVSRADVADFMLRQVSENSYLQGTPGVSY